MIDARLKPQGDFDNYYTIGTTPGRPYVDFAVEFPLGTTQVFRMLAPMTGSRERFGDALVILNVIADIAIVAALSWGWGIEAAACYALIVAPLADLFFLRTDLWSTAVATLAVAAWQRKRAALAAIGFVAGAAFKLWPLTFLPLLVVPSRGRERMVPLALAPAAGLAVLRIVALGRRTTGTLPGAHVPRRARLARRKQCGRRVDAVRMRALSATNREPCGLHDEQSEIYGIVPRWARWRRCGWCGEARGPAISVPGGRAGSARCWRSRRFSPRRVPPAGWRRPPAWPGSNATSASPS